MRVEIDFDETSQNRLWLVVHEELLVWLSIFTNKQELIKLLSSILLNILDADVYLAVNAVLLQLTLQRLMELDDVSVLFSVLKRLGKALETSHWVLNTLHQTIGPADSTSDGRHIRRDRGVLIFFFNEHLALLVGLVDFFDIRLEKFEQVLLLLLKLIINDFSL